MPCGGQNVGLVLLRVGKLKQWVLTVNSWDHLGYRVLKWWLLYENFKSMLSYEIWWNNWKKKKTSYRKPQLANNKLLTHWLLQYTDIAQIWALLSPNPYKPLQVKFYASSSFARLLLVFLFWKTICQPHIYTRWTGHLEWSEKNQEINFNSFTSENNSENFLILPTGHPTLD